MKALVCLLGAVLTVSVSAQTIRFQNADPQALLVYWTMAGAPGTPVQIQAGLPLAPGGRRTVAPGERVEVALGNRFLAVVFVPTGGVSLRTLVMGGYLLASDFPRQGTVALSPTAFDALPARRWTSTLAEWGLPVPRIWFGDSARWKAIPALAEWGPGFAPPEGPWPSGVPRLTGLQAALRDDGLWLRLTWTPSALAMEGDVSLILRRPGAGLEWPWLGTDRRVWLWSGKAEPLAVGIGTSASGVYEARVALDRLPDLVAWGRESASWQLVVARGGVVATYTLAPFTWGDLP